MPIPQLVARPSLATNAPCTSRPLHISHPLRISRTAQFYRRPSSFMHSMNQPNAVRRLLWSMSRLCSRKCLSAFSTADPQDIIQGPARENGVGNGVHRPAGTSHAAESGVRMRQNRAIPILGVFRKRLRRAVSGFPHARARVLEHVAESGLVARGASCRMDRSFVLRRNRLVVRLQHVRHGLGVIIP